MLLIASFVLALTWAAPALAQDEADAPETSPAPAPTTYSEPIPDTLPEVQAQISKTEQQIEQLNSEAEKLVSMAEQEKRQQLRNQIKSLKLRLKILLRREQQLLDTASTANVSEVRERYRARLLEIEQRKAAARRNAIARFEQVLAENPNTGLAAGILFRLANLYFEEAHDRYLGAWDRYEFEAEQLVSQGATDVVPEEPRHNYARSIELLDQVLKGYPGYEQRDEVRYLMAYCLQEQNDDDRALIIYEEMIKETPDSAKVPEAYVRMGEIYFNRDQYERAIERYQHLLKFDDSKFYDKALYKLGWCYYKLSDYTNAVKYFSEVLLFYKNRPATRKRGADDLLQESVDYIAISFTDSEGQDGSRAAVAFMKQVGDQKIGRQVLLKVGEVYDERTDYDPARGAYNSYIESFPLAPDIPEVMSKLAATYEKEQRFGDAMEVYDRIAKTLGPGSEWSVANGARLAESERAAKLVQTSIMARATFHHEKAQNTSGAESQAHYTKAVESYELFLANYPDSDGAYETSFNLGECYMELARYNDAATQYQRVIAIKKDKELWTAALFNNAKAYELEVERVGGLPNKEAVAEPGTKTSADAESPKGVAIKPTAMGPAAASWVAALDTHVTELPDSDKSPAMLYKIGEIYYMHGDFANANQYFEQVFAKYPGHEVVALASYYYVESFKQQSDYIGIKAALQKLPEGGATGISAEDIQAMSAGATFKIAEQMMKDATATTPANPSKVQDAINEYEKGIRENANTDSAGVALYNVAVAYEKHMNDLLRANDAYVRLAAGYAKSEHASKGLLHAAYNYQILAEFDKAIETYELFVRTWPDRREEAGDALFNAATLMDESGQLVQAASAYQSYLTNYASETDAGQVAYSIAQISEKMGDTAGAEAGYQNYAERGPDDAGRMAEAFYRWGDLLAKRGAVQDAEKRYLQAVAVFIKAREVDPKVDARYAAEAQFRVAMQYYDVYRNIVFTGDIRKDAALLQAKAEAFKKLKIYYEDIVTFGNYEWATAALHMLGIINQDFSDALLNAPVPEDLPPEQQDEYVFKLEEIAFPIKNRALEAFKQNFQKGINERAINEWIIKSYGELKRLEPTTAEPKFEVTSAVETPAFALAPLDTTLPDVAPPPVAATPAAPGGTPAGDEKPKQEVAP